MDKIDSLNQVAKFHSTFKHPILATPQIPAASRCELRVSLLQEELNELKEAIDNNDLVEVAELFNEVQRSNMSKACKTLEEAEKTVAHYKERKGESAHIEEDNGLFLVYRDGDKKTLKSIGYSPADLKGIIEK